MGFDQVAAGIDIGSTNLKAIIITPEGMVVGRASVPTPRRPSDQMIDATCLFSEVNGLLNRLCGSRYRIRAISTAGIGEDGTLVDAQLRPLSAALPWFATERQALFEMLSPSLAPSPLTGIDPDPFRTLTGWYWAARQEGHEHAYAWLALSDYAAAQWCQSAFMSDSLAARTAAYLPQSGAWDDARVTASLGKRSLLPPVVRTGHVVGPVTRTGSANPVFAPDALVVAGGHDHPTGGWGITQLSPTAILDSMGTAEVVVTQNAPYPVPFPAGIDVAPGILSQGATLLCVEELARNLAWASRDSATGAMIAGLFSGVSKPDSFLESGCFIPGSHGGHAPAFTDDAPLAPLSRASAVVGALARAGETAIERINRFRAASWQANPAQPDVGTTQPDLYLSGGWSRAPGWVAIKRQLGSHPFRIVREPELTAASAALLAARALGWTPSVMDLLMPEEQHL
ncbi:FGGY family carbohydrate kinase [Asaia bogorensis]|uniref:FGGY family carbohydrate kinase n=1 Tax=Asaia bogorensis TaxID=91915 RepID=UPI000EFC51BC|nr:FGGY family carbohydrate kinase [Asaia bogorensis]